MTRTTDGAVLHLALPFVTRDEVGSRPERRRARRDRGVVSSAPHPARRTGAAARRRCPGGGRRAAGAGSATPRPVVQESVTVSEAEPARGRARAVGQRGRGGRQAAAARCPTGRATRAPTSARGSAGLASQAAASLHDINEHLATGSAECTYCPVCRTVHAVRQTSPEVRAHLAQAASSLMHAAAGMLATDAAAGAPAARAGRRADRPRRRARRTRTMTLTCGVDVGGTKIAGAVVDDRGQGARGAPGRVPGHRHRGDRGRDRRPGHRARLPPRDRGGRRRRRRLRRRVAVHGDVRSQPRLARRGPARPSSRSGSTCRSWSRTTPTRRRGASSASAPARTSTTCCWSRSAPASAAGSSSTASSSGARSASAAEIGHLRVVPGGRPCGCGNRGCLEQYGSGLRAGRKAARDAADRPEAAGACSTAAGGDPEAITGPLITELGAGRRPVRRSTQLAELGRWLGEGIASLAAVLDPAVVVIGGGVSEAGDLLLDPIRDAFARAAHRPRAPARGGDPAGHARQPARA